MNLPTREDTLVKELKGRSLQVLDGDFKDIQLEKLSICRMAAWLIVSINIGGPFKDWPQIYVEMPKHLQRPDDAPPNYEMIENYALPVLRRAMVLDDLAQA
jgi:hypothetical protein